MNTKLYFALKSLITAVALTFFSGSLFADDSFLIALSQEVNRDRTSNTRIDQSEKRAWIQRSHQEIIEKGCGPVGTLEGFQQAQYERGERKYPPIRLHVLAISKKLDGVDDGIFNRLGSEVLRYRDDFRGGKILLTEFSAALQSILEQL